MTIFNGWANFYVIVGSSAGALIGLQFVVITLIARMQPGRGAEQASDAFSTPSVVHFGVVLLLSAVVSAPWQGIGVSAILWGLVGCSGIAYTIVVAWRMRAQTVYRPVSLLDAPRPVRPRRSGTAAPLCRHSQCLGHGHTPRLCRDTETR